jgi:hypothetical protein
MSYDAQKDLDYIEYNISYFMNIIGMNPENLNSTTIDELVESARTMAIVTSARPSEVNTFTSGDNSQDAVLSYHSEPDYLYLRSQRIHLLSSIRRFWYLRQVALGALNRG